MAPAAELGFVQKRFIVQQLACYETPTAVVKAVKEQFGLEISRQRVQCYDPTCAAGKALAEDLKALFAETRDRFLDRLSDIPIANKAVRLATLQRMVNLAESRGQIPVVGELLEQAAKECGDAFTNKQKLEHTGKDGGPIETKAEELSDMEAARRMAFLLTKGLKATGT